MQGFMLQSSCEKTGTEPQGLALPPIAPTREALAELNELPAILEKLLEGSSLSDFNRSVLAVLKRHGEALSDQSDLGRIDEFKELLLQAVVSQNYCSPTVERRGGIYQAGLIQIPPWMRYIRSEMTSSIYGERYDKNSVIIRAKSATSFRTIAAHYIAHSPNREQLEVRSLLEDRAREARDRSVFVVRKECSPTEAMTELVPFISSSMGEGGLYLKLSEPLQEADLALVRQTLQASSMQIIIEEPYRPHAVAGNDMVRVRFLHNEQDPLRYQLLQDAASMGYRLDLAEVVRSFLQAGSLSSLLNLESRIEASFPSPPDSSISVQTVHDRHERDSDFKMLALTIGSAQESLRQSHPRTELERDLHALASDRLSLLEEQLRCYHSKSDHAVSDTVELFHRVYYEVRTLSHYTAYLWAQQHASIRSLEEKIESIEGGAVIAANSGMSATRAVLVHLQSKGVTCFSTPHYWETDFLIENIFAHNPHYPEVQHKAPSRLIMHPPTGDGAQISKFVSAIIADNKNRPEGQLLCIDRSISPFFYTKHFDLHAFCKCLQEKRAEIVNPIYLVVDPTLDLGSVSNRTLFPEGIPHNVIFISTLSHAKLHQVGFDLVPGGLIHIDTHESQRACGEALRNSLAAALDSEGTRQLLPRLATVYQLYYRHCEEGTLPEYLRYMVGKRQRNTQLLAEEIRNASAPLHRTDREHTRFCDANGNSTLIFTDAQGEKHSVEIELSYDPNSALHSYLKISQPPSKKYIAKELFEEIKTRVFALAASQGIHIGDGTSWGFTTTRLDYYMHTLRIATGLEHTKTIRKLGVIIGDVLSELCSHPDTALGSEQVLPFEGELITSDRGDFITLASHIPHAAGDQGMLAEYEARLKEGAHFSRILKTQGTLSSFLFAYPRERSGERELYISKAATLPKFQGQGQFRRLLNSVKRQAVGEGLSKITLRTSASARNAGVIKAYERCGFSVAKVEVDSYQDGWPLIMVEMELPLQGAQKQKGVFCPIPPAVYAAVKESGTLEALSQFLTGLHVAHMS
jgi:GNAT superfamily N-acetyltransferase